jgi:murein DD-endopeptidase MepM/ murein hydrolase activator NlpD
LRDPPLAETEAEPNDGPWGGTRAYELDLMMTLSGWLGILVAVLLVGLGVLGWVRWESDVPVIAGPESLMLGSAGGDLALDFDDEGTGLKDIRVVIVHAKGETVLAERSFPGSVWAGAARRGSRPVEAHIDPKALGLPDGDAFIQVSARDWSWTDGFSGNTTEIKIPLSIDRKPPRISVASGLTYVKRGGSGAVVYSVSEDSVRDGVSVGDAFFRGHPLSGRQRVAIFAVPTDAAQDPQLMVVAEDGAGNSSSADWPVVVKERALPDAQVTLPKRFLDRKVPPLAEANGIDTADLDQAFREINTTLRQANEKQIREILSDTAPEALWSGGFSQMLNSKVTSRFAEQRRYFIDGRANSEAVHFGYDLASTSAAAITAAADGKVVFADDLGIYGQCVLIDHGLDVATLYGHLSRLDVEPGDVVRKEQPLGLSGATGLAGGDHLHFAILVGETYVDPLEWWDDKWVQTHIDTQLRPGGS